MDTSVPLNNQAQNMAALILCVKRNQFRLVLLERLFLKLIVAAGSGYKSEVFLIIHFHAGMLTLDMTIG